MRGHSGWDTYAAFYDWENARTMGRRDVAFWKTAAVEVSGPVLELGCGTGRITAPLARAGVRTIGIDRSPAMLGRASRRLRRIPHRAGGLVRGDVTALPFAAGSIELVAAPYGLLQSILSDRALAHLLGEVRRVLTPGGRFGIDLVPDVPNWAQYRDRVSLRGTRGRARSPIRLIESVRQDRRRRVTIFDQQFVEGRGRSRVVHRFQLAFRSLTLPQIARRLVKAGFTLVTAHGDYRGGAWRPEADTWLIWAS